MHIPFFHRGLPGEVLISRVSRHHLVEGNKSVAATLTQLFGLPRTDVGYVVPKGIETLAARLPGDHAENLRALVSENTLLPLFLPFIGTTGATASDVKARAELVPSRLPRRAVGQHGNASLCVRCLADDEHDHGIAYWHRDHQAPGVAVCWRHRVRLMNNCSHCGLPFQRTQRLLEVPWRSCAQCRTDARDGLPDLEVTDVEAAYANYVHQMLNESLPPVSAAVLAATYRNAIKRNGYSRGTLAAVSDFTEAMITSLGEDFVRYVDPAYSSGKTTFWLRFSICEDAIDMPISRHLLLSMHLFGTPARFG